MTTLSISEARARLYQLVDETVRLVYLEAVGPHENFDRDIRR